MTLIERIRALIAQVNPDYKFEYENDFMMNVKADDDRFPIAYLEEYTEGRYTIGYGTKKSVMVELHFYRLVPMHCSAMVRERERNRIEEEIVRPFIEKFNDSGDFEDVSEFTIFPEPTMFDANATGLMLRFWATYRMC